MSQFKKIPVFDIALGQKEKEYIKDCVDTSFIGQGPYVKKSEKFSSFVDCKWDHDNQWYHCLALSLCSHCIKKNDQVLVSSSTNMACPFVIDYCVLYHSNRY